MTDSGAKGLCVPTAYATVDQLVRALHPFAEDTTLFVATPLDRAVGVESPFAILLADRTPAIQGWCIVVDAWTDPAESPYGARGLRVGLYRLTPSSEHVLAQVREAREARQPVEPPQIARRPVTIRIPTVIPPSSKRKTPTELPIVERTAPIEVAVVAIPPRSAEPVEPPAILAEGSQPMTIPPPRRQPPPPPPPRPRTESLDSNWDTDRSGE
jgi:hypothetical protein